MSYSEDVLLLGKKVQHLLHEVGRSPAPHRPRADWLASAYAAGLVRKGDLRVGKYYFGVCRNASVALWVGDRFTYIREKFGTRYYEDINCPEDDNGFDLFLAVGEVEPLIHERVGGKE